MTYKKCCVPKCPNYMVKSAEYKEKGITLHTFPNPEKDRDRFLRWVKNIGGELPKLEHEYIHKNRRVCCLHFEQKYIFLGSSKVSISAIPTLLIPGFVNNEDIANSDGEMKELVPPYSVLEVEKYFIKKFEHFGQLWDVKHKLFHDKDERIEAYEKLLLILKKIKPNATMKCVKKKIKSFKGSYKMELKRRMDCEKSGNRRKVYKPKWYYNNLNFLRKNEPMALESECQANQNTQEKNPHATQITKPNATFMQWAYKMERLNPVQRQYAKKAIEDILHQAELGNLKNDSITINSSVPSTAGPKPNPLTMVTYQICSISPIESEQDLQSNMLQNQMCTISAVKSEPNLQSNVSQTYNQMCTISANKPQSYMLQNDNQMCTTSAIKSKPNLQSNVPQTYNQMCTISAIKSEPNLESNVLQTCNQMCSEPAIKCEPLDETFEVDVKNGILTSPFEQTELDIKFDISQYSPFANSFLHSPEPPSLSSFPHPYSPLYFF